MQQNQSEAQVINAVPESGQLVEVRRRRWLVADTVASSSTGPDRSRQHFVSLNSVEDDGLGERLDVVWEIEPGAHIIERAGLPKISGCDDAIQLDAFLDAVRWGAATNADRGFLQAPFRSGISIEDYQLDPLVRAIDMARTNLLIADDVGLGKTIEAGLVMQELLLRHRARTVLVICPASLQEKWRMEILEKFGLEFRIVNTDYIRTLRRERGIHANPWTSYPRLIASVDWMKSGEPLRLLQEVVPLQPTFPRKFDLMIVDEAHNVAPAGTSHYVLESQRTRLVRMLAPHFQHKLFLTATPHNGFTESFTSLLELLDDQRFSRSVIPNQKQLDQILIRRLKTDLVDADGDPIYPKRVLEILPIPYTVEEREIHATLEKYCDSRRTTCADAGVAGTHFINTLLKKRLLSSPAAFSGTLHKHHDSIGRDLSTTVRSDLEERILKRALERAEEDYADDREAENAQSEAVEEASSRVPALTDDEKQWMETMLSWAQENANRADSKAHMLIDWIETHLRSNGNWLDERVILFTEYRATHQWLLEILAAHGLSGDGLMIMHGGMDQAEREIVNAAFQAHPNDSPVRILLATDAASEGIDLQNHCNKLVHLEIPYNPNVMEQRNGRIDRYGQRRDEVQIWHPVDGGDGMVGGHGEHILRALNKLESMRADMGSVNPVIAPQITELLNGKREELDTREAEARATRQKRFVKSERQLKDRIEKLHERLNETRRDFHLEPTRILTAVTTALSLHEKPPLIPTSLNGASAGTVFTMPALTGSWAKCAEGLRHPHTHTIRPITFDHDVAKGRDNVVLIHLNHRLVQMSLRVLRAEVWAQEDVKRMHRVSVRSLSTETLEDPIVIVSSRLVITGGNHYRLHEELTEAAGYLHTKGFKRETKVTTVQSWLEFSQPTDVDDRTFDMLTSRYAIHADSILSMVEARSKDRLRNLRQTIDSRMQKEIDDIQTVLSELESAIQAELNRDQEPEQFELFSPDERTQVKRDRDALRARLMRIPEERDREQDIIAQRYDDLTEHTFPVAVTFILPVSSGSI